MEIKDLIKEAHDNAVEHGFWEDVELSSNKIMTLKYSKLFDEVAMESESINAIGNRLMLIVGEIAEAQEGLRKDDIPNFKEELADVAIRLFDLCGGLGIDLENEIQKKMKSNEQRPYKHNKKF